MRTGNYRFVTAYTQRKWFRPSKPVQALMVEVEEPTDVSGTRALRWRRATPSDVEDYLGRQRSRETALEEAVRDHHRLRERLDDMGRALHHLSSRATLL